MADSAHLESHILEGAIAEGGLQARLGHVLPQVGVLVQAPVLDEVVHLRLDFPASRGNLSLAHKPHLRLHRTSIPVPLGQE